MNILIWWAFLYAASSLCCWPQEPVDGPPATAGEETVQVEQSDDESHPLLRKAEELSATGRPGEAQAALDMAMQSFEAQEDWANYFLAVGNKASLWHEAERYAEAIAMLEDGMSRYHKRLPDSTTPALARMHHELGKSLYRTPSAENSRIIGHYRQATAIYDKLQMPGEAAAAKMGLGLALFTDTQAEPAERCLNESLQWFQKDEKANGKNIGKCLFYLGVLYKQQYQADRAISYLEKSLEYSVPARDTITIGYGYNNLGLALSSRYEYQPALEYCYQALKIFREYYGEAHRSIGYVNNVLGNIYLAQEQYPEALGHFKKGYEIFRQTQGEDAPLTAGLLMNVGVVQEKLQQYDKALSTYREVIRLHQLQANPHFDKFKVHRNIALVHLAQGDTLAARRKLLDAETAGAQALETHSMLWVDLYLDQAALSGHSREAAGYFQKAMEKLYEDKSSLLELEEKDFDQARSPLFLFKLIVAQARHSLEAYKQDGQPEQLAHAQRLSRLGNQLAGYIRREQRSEESKLEFMALERGHLQTAAETAHLAYRQDKSAELLHWIFELMEQHKALLLSEALDEKRVKENLGIPDSLLERENELFAAINRKKQKLATGAQEAEDSIELMNKLFELNQGLSALKARLTEHYPAYYQLKYREDSLSIPDIQAYLASSHTILLEYLIHDDFLSTLAITADTVLYRHSPLDSTFFGLLRNMRQFFSRRKALASDARLQEEKQQYIHTARALYDKLLRPVLEQLPKADELIIIPDGELGYLPFELLLTHSPEQGDYRLLPYLFRDHTLRYEYSAGLLLRQTPPGKKRVGRLLAVAPRFDEGLMAAAGHGQLDSLEFSRAFPGLREGMAPLHYNIPEVRDVTQLAGGTALTEQQATKSAFVRLGGQHRILHLATHAYTNDLQPGFSHLVFAAGPEGPGSRFLYAYEIYNLRLNAELAVLSACETGAGKLQSGEGIMSLSRAFKYAGCPNIATSLWQADDRSTRDIMARFYAHLKEGMGKAGALRQAKLDFLASAEQRLTHPFYWGTFILIGDNAPVDLEAAGFPGWWWGAALLLLVLGFLWWRRP